MDEKEMNNLALPAYKSVRSVRTDKIDFIVVSHFGGWEGIERKLAAMLLEDIFDAEINDENA